ncbi:MAG: hypothetical protein M1823_002716 [Watsoniomyces obsoletus]|nr:MAG: hypothetical protein M1823_002716 [Watsoniomyces obsoletus]
MPIRAGLGLEQGHEQIRGARTGSSAVSSTMPDLSMPRSLSSTDPNQTFGGMSLTWNGGLWGNSTTRGALMGAGGDVPRVKAAAPVSASRDQTSTTFQAPTGSGSLLSSSEQDDGQRHGTTNYTWHASGTPSPGLPQPQHYPRMPSVSRASEQSNLQNNSMQQPTMPTLLGTQPTSRFSATSSLRGSGSAGASTPVSGPAISSLQSSTVNRSERLGASRLSGDAPPFQFSHLSSIYSPRNNDTARTSLSTALDSLQLNMPSMNPNNPAPTTPFVSSTGESSSSNESHSLFRPQFDTLSDEHRRPQTVNPAASSVSTNARSAVLDDFPFQLPRPGASRPVNHNGPLQGNLGSMNHLAQAKYRSSSGPSSQQVPGLGWGSNPGNQQPPAYQDNNHNNHNNSTNSNSHNNYNNTIRQDTIRQESPRSLYSWTNSDIDQLTGFGVSGPERISEIPFMDQLPSMPPARGSNRDSRSQSGSSSQRPSLQSPYYSAMGTPSMGSDRFQQPFHGSGVPNAYHPDEHSMDLDQRLRELQLDQQGLPVHQAFPTQQALNRMPMTSPYRGLQTVNPYGYFQQGALGTNHPGGNAVMQQFMPPLGMWPNQMHPRSMPQHGRQATRKGSPFLEAFKLGIKTGRRYELHEIHDHMVEFCGDQAGSRFLQYKLETAPGDEKERIFTEIRPNVRQLMMDHFGNYVIQKMFEYGTMQQKAMLAGEMKGHMVNLSKHPFACRVIQTILDHVLVDQQAALIKELQPNVLSCIDDQHGNHVIQKAVEVIPLEHIRFIIDAFVGQVATLATHQFGCRVIQRILEHCGEEGQSKILGELFEAGPALIQDQYGNYVAQHVIEKGKEEHRTPLIERVTEELVQYSMHKFASNVVEKSIEHGTDEQRRAFLTILTTLSSEGISPLQSLVEDPYGNYVIRKLIPRNGLYQWEKLVAYFSTEKLLNKTKGVEHDRLVEEVRPHLESMKRQKSGKQVTALEKLIQNTSNTNSDAETVTSPTGTTVEHPQPHQPSSFETPTAGLPPPTETSSTLPAQQPAAGEDQPWGGH